MDTPGGYDFQVIGELAEEYECPICLLLIKEAVELPCTHGLCKACLQKWEKEPPSSCGYLCPTCKAVYQEGEVQRSKIFDRMITCSLKVKCKEFKYGCEWTGTISDYNTRERLGYGEEEDTLKGIIYEEAEQEHPESQESTEQQEEDVDLTPKEHTVSLNKAYRSFILPGIVKADVESYIALDTVHQDTDGRAD